MNVMKITVLFFLCISFDAVSQVDKRADETKKEEKKESIEEEQFFPRIDLIFDNPFLQKSLNAGAQVINNSIDSLLEGIFYSLLDNEFSQNLTTHVQVVENLGRTVFTTGEGKYVVVDRLLIGPRYRREVMRHFDIIFNHGVDASVDMLNIYLRSDPQRVAEEVSLPTWRYVFNNWFGVLPFLERVLPPSFNANELYDPLRQLESPFTFPFDKNGFAKMETGSIRSYALQGGLTFPINLEQISDTRILDNLNRLGFEFTVPYTIFVDGEYRINVLKKSENIAWVGLSKTKKAGHSVSGVIGTTYFLLANSLRPLPWKGIPTQLSPIDVSLIWSLIDKFDHLYEFDLTTKAGYGGFQQAIRGDFTFARKDKPLRKGVTFHFHRQSDSTVKTADNSKNFLLLYKNKQDHSQTKAEVKIKDEKGEFFVLENESRYDNETWNILTGEKEVNLSHELALNVEKVLDPKSTLDDPKFHYTFHRTMKPQQLVLKLQIKDRFARVHDFYSYIDLLRLFTKLPFKGIPKIPVIDKNELKERRRRSPFISPLDSPGNFHVTNTIIGKFNATALVVFDSPVIAQIIRRSEDEKRAAFYKAFDQDVEENGLSFFDRLRYYALYPLRIANLSFDRINLPVEVRDTLRAFLEITPESEPLDVLDAFYEMFDTEYPHRLASALYLLSPKKEVPRKATLYIDPARHLEDSVKKLIGSLNEKTFEATAPFPDLERHRIARNKLNAFVPIHLKEEQGDVNILKILPGEGKAVSVVIKGHLSQQRKWFFVRVETKGTLKLGKSVIGQKIVEVLPFDVSPKEDTLSYKIVLEDFERQTLDTQLWQLFENASLAEGKEYRLVVSASLDGKSWGETSSFAFRYQSGVLVPIETSMN